MNLRLTALSALVGISLAAFALPSNACFTVIVGKKVSSTGEILVGHNEDNEMQMCIRDRARTPPYDGVSLVTTGQRAWTRFPNGFRDSGQTAS